jgi:hypothetical protein
LRSSLSWRVTWDCCSIIIGLRCSSALIYWKHFVFVVSHLLDLPKLARTCPDLPYYTRGRVHCLTCRMSGLSFRRSRLLHSFLVHSVVCLLLLSTQCVTHQAPPVYFGQNTSTIRKTIVILLPNGATGTMHKYVQKNWNFYFSPNSVIMVFI